MVNMEKHGQQGKKERKLEIQQFEYLKNETSFLDEIKSMFHNYLSLKFDKKMKNSGRKL